MIRIWVTSLAPWSYRPSSKDSSQSCLFTRCRNPNKMRMARKRSYNLRRRIRIKMRMKETCWMKTRRLTIRTNSFWKCKNILVWHHMMQKREKSKSCVLIRGRRYCTALAMTAGSRSSAFLRIDTYSIISSAVILRPSPWFFTKTWTDSMLLWKKVPSSFLTSQRWLQLLSIR